jgi:iron complex transport system ATP-binding protein
MICGCNLKVGYDGRIVLKDLGITIEKGEIVTLIGPNGSGKSTLLKAISRLLDCMSGTVLLDGKDIHKINTREVARRMAVLPQTQHMPPDFTVEELVAHGRIPHHRWFEIKNDNDQEIIKWAINAAKLEHLADRLVVTLSGGERQRAWIALALAQKPEVLLMDEPTTFLDICHQLEVMELVKSLNKDMGITVIMVLHDLNQAASHSHRIIVLNKGCIVASGNPKDVISKELLKDVYNINAEVIVNKCNGCPAVFPLGLVAAV